MSKHGEQVVSALLRSTFKREWAIAGQGCHYRSIYSGLSTVSALHDERNRLSRFWIPQLRTALAELKDVDSNRLLIRAGFIQQRYSGFFNLLPLGLRVQDKLERLIDRHMNLINASKLALSSISSQEIWQRSGRLSADPDLFKFEDRKEAKWLLSPTHEEEITSLVASLIQSYRDLPCRLYQISRKYRDEPRPRQGLLRSKEFLMKDLYTFDITPRAAMHTYDIVQQAYRDLFDELKLPYLVARADSGNMGGSLSHEFHFPSSKGEDNIVCCSRCDFVKNEEVADAIELEPNEVPLKAESRTSVTTMLSEDMVGYIALSRDKRTLIKAYAPRNKSGFAKFVAPEAREINTYAVKAAVPDSDLSHEFPETVWEDAYKHQGPAESDGETLFSIKYIFDRRLDTGQIECQLAKDDETYKSRDLKYRSFVMGTKSDERGIDLLKPAPGDPCPQCTEGELEIVKAIEIGHTFHLGDRYSKALGAEVSTSDPAEAKAPMQMGCHGIGVSRLIAAVASALADDRGLNWPAVIAPFQVVIIVRRTDYLKDAAELYDRLGSELPGVDAIIDDRHDRDMVYRLFDADIIGYPIVLLLGRGWPHGNVEIQCRRLGRGKESGDVPVEEASAVIRGLLDQL